VHRQSRNDDIQHFLKVVTSGGQRRIIDEGKLRRLRNNMPRDCLLFTPIDRQNVY
jgi:hypothetical protein